jgi:lipopolysaccharide/colanic/teichoic acid biosynthesis glycosyltransferase
MHLCDGNDGHAGPCCGSLEPLFAHPLAGKVLSRTIEDILAESNYAENVVAGRAREATSFEPSAGTMAPETFQFVVLKRMVDVVIASIGLTLAAPLLVLLAILVKLDSRGPVFFAGDRLGLGARRFRMYKFRTMRDGADAEKPSVAHLNRSDDSRLFKIPADPRVTRLGRTMRRWSLDELPQLYNVLIGDMSLVGPRPFFEVDLSRYEPRHCARLLVKPGVTGLWQVSGRSEILDFEEVVRLDCEYIEHWSLGLDLWILGRTLPVVIDRRGAY